MKKEQIDSVSNFKISQQIERSCKNCHIIEKDCLLSPQQLCTKCQKNQTQAQNSKNYLLSLDMTFHKKSNLQDEQNQFKEQKQEQRGKSQRGSIVQMQLIQQKRQNDSSNESEEQHQKIEEKKLLQNIRTTKQQIIAQKKVIIGTGFTYDMTDYFKFKKKLPGEQPKEETFLSQFSGSRIAWIILFYTITSSAIVPGWIMNIQATKFIRQCWRFLMQAFIIIPFLLHQKRTASQQNKQKYELSYIFKPTNIIKPYISSLASSLYFLLILSSFQWTYVSHGIVLSSISNFFLSIGRSFRKTAHDIQLGGQMLVILGVFLVFNDSFTLDTINKGSIQDDDYLTINTFYLYRTWYQRIGGDIVAILTSLMMSEFSKYTSDLRSYYPPFLSMMLVNIFNVFNMGLITFFFNGGSFDFDPFWGFFSIFTDVHFISFMYMAIILTLGQLVSVLMITKMFPDPIIPALGMTLQPFIACFIVHLGNVQNLPGDFSMIGFIFIFPGLLLVLMGQCFFQRQKSTAQESDRRVQNLLQEIKQLKKINSLPKITKKLSYNPINKSNLSRNFSSAQHYKKGNDKF